MTAEMIAATQITTLVLIFWGFPYFTWDSERKWNCSRVRNFVNGKVKMPTKTPERIQAGPSVRKCNVTIPILSKATDRQCQIVGRLIP